MRVRYAQTPKPSILRKTVTADARSRENNIGMGGAHADRLQHLDEVHPVSFRKEAPFVQISKDGRPVGIFHNFAGFAFDGPVQDRERKFFYVQNLGEENSNLFPGLFIDPAADPPEIADRGNVLFPGHDPFEGMRQEGFHVLQARALQRPFS